MTLMLCLFVVTPFLFAGRTVYKSWKNQEPDEIQATDDLLRLLSGLSLTLGVAATVVALAFNLEIITKVDLKDLPKNLLPVLLPSLIGTVGNALITALSAVYLQWHPIRVDPQAKLIASLQSALTPAFSEAMGRFADLLPSAVKHLNASTEGLNASISVLAKTAKDGQELIKASKDTSDAVLLGLKGVEQGFDKNNSRLNVLVSDLLEQNRKSSADIANMNSAVGRLPADFEKALTQASDVIRLRFSDASINYSEKLLVSHDRVLTEMTARMEHNVKAWQNTVHDTMTSALKAISSHLVESSSLLVDELKANSKQFTKNVGEFGLVASTLDEKLLSANLAVIKQFIEHDQTRVNDLSGAMIDALSGSLKDTLQRVDENASAFRLCADRLHTTSEQLSAESKQHAAVRTAVDALAENLIQLVKETKEHASEFQKRQHETLDHFKESLESVLDPVIRGFLGVILDQGAIKHHLDRFGNGAKSS